MRILCAPKSSLASTTTHDLEIVLYDLPSKSIQGSVGAQIPYAIRSKKLEPARQAWDLLSIALSVVAADVIVSRASSPDGWSRSLDLQIAVGDPTFWTSQIDILTRQLRFLTTDIWNLTFFERVLLPSARQTRLALHGQDSVALLSGGLDSLIGVVDLISGEGKNLLLQLAILHEETEVGS